MLTEKNMKVLKLILDEKTNKEIAELLGVHERSVEKQRRRIYKMTNCKTLIALVIYAIENKIIKTSSATPEHWSAGQTVRSFNPHPDSFEAILTEEPKSVLYNLQYPIEMLISKNQKYE